MSTSEYPATRAPAGSPASAGRARAISIRQIPVDVWMVGALVVVAAAIRILTIDNQSFWSDEALTAYEAHLPFGAMINTVEHVETTPPCTSCSSWAWAHVFGTGEVALRSISTIAGIALVPIAYLAARDLVSRWAGVLAAAFVTVNPFLIWYSQEARAYMLLAFLCGASFLFFVRARERSVAAQPDLVGGVLGAGGDDPLLRRASWSRRRRCGCCGWRGAVGGGRRGRGGRRAARRAAARRHRHQSRPPVDRAGTAEAPRRLGDPRVGGESAAAPRDDVGRVPRRRGPAGDRRVCW